MAAPIALLSTQHAQFITQYRDAVTALLHINNTFQALQDQYMALNLAVELNADDFTTGNSDTTLTHLLAAIISIEAIRANFTRAQMTNLYRVKK